MEAAGKVDTEDTGRATCLTDSTGPTQPAETVGPVCLPRAELAVWAVQALGASTVAPPRRRTATEGSKRLTSARATSVHKRRRSMLLQAAFLIATGFSRSVLRRPCENAAYQELRTAALAVLANVEHDE